MKTILLQMPDGTPKVFNQIKNTLNNRIKALEFDKESERLLEKQKQETASLPKDTPVLEVVEAAAKDQVEWLCRGIKKASMLIDRTGLTPEEIQLLDSDPKEEFWSNQDLEAIAAFHSSF